MTKDGINELEDRLLECTYSEKQRENRLKKLTESWGTCGTIAKEVAFVSSDFRKRDSMLLKKCSIK